MSEDRSPDNAVVKEKRGIIDKELLEQCIHCGLCLPACPTYLATGRESESPRGRIYLMGLWESQRIELTNDVADHLESCLGCLGCQTACPSGVKYGSLLDQMRPQLTKRRSPFIRFVSWMAFKIVLPSPVLLCIMGWFIRLCQATPLNGLLLSFAPSLSLESSPLEVSDEQVGEEPPLSLLGRFGRWYQYLPAVPPFKRLDSRNEPATTKTSATAKSAGPVQFFKGCIMDVFYNDVNHSCVRLINCQNRAVCVPEQTCCGALAMHAGELDIAVELAKRNIEYFENTDGPIVVSAAGCGAMLKEYPHVFAQAKEQNENKQALPDYERFHDRAVAFSNRIQDITETLANGEFVAGLRSNLTRFEAEAKIAYHAACHLAHAQGVRQQPDILLGNLAKAVSVSFASQGTDNKSDSSNGQPVVPDIAPGVSDDKPGVLDLKESVSASAQGVTAVGTVVELLPLQEKEHCCGSAGIYNLIHVDLSHKVLTRKLQLIAESGADVVVTTNPGCQLQLTYGVKRTNSPIRVMHLAQLLDRYYSNL